MRTSVTELPESRVRIDVGIEPDAVEKRVERAARGLGAEMRLPGFRKGKVPAQLVLQRVGREAVLDQALRDSLPEWYERALLEAGVAAVGDPKLSVESLPGPGEELAFSIEVAVRPKAKLGNYRGLEAGRAEPEVPDDAVQAELDRLREAFASLAPVERPASEGDVIVIDYDGRIEGEPFEGSEARDFTVELREDGLLPEFRKALTGSSGGDELEVTVAFPEEHRPDSLAGKTATFAVKVKEVREKRLPELNDEFASEASEFDTRQELEDEIRARIGAALERQAEQEFREAAVDAATDASQVEIPQEIVTARAEEMWERLEHSLAHRGVSGEAYLQMQGTTREQVIEEAQERAERSLRREATLAAIADAEGIEVSDEELLQALGPGEGDEDPRRLLSRLTETGRDALLREEVRLRKAADLVVAEAKPIPLERAVAREKLWTPEKEREEKGALWTPGEGT